MTGKKLCCVCKHARLEMQMAVTMTAGYIVRIAHNMHNFAIARDTSAEFADHIVRFCTSAVPHLVTH